MNKSTRTETGAVWGLESMGGKREKKRLVERQGHNREQEKRTNKRGEKNEDLSTGKRKGTGRD